MKKSILLFVLVLFLSSTKADILDNSISGMLSNITQPQSISNNMAGGFMGGSLYLRTPNATVNFVTIDLPRFSAGCGGIDATLGGFSFISSQKLMAFFRKVIQQAIPVAFNLALNQLNPQIAKILKDFQTWAQKAAALSANSCQLATGLVTAAKDGEINQSNSLSSLWQATKGLTTDFGLAQDNNTANPGAGTTAVMQNAPADKGGGLDLSTDFSCQLGNLTWCALKQKSDNGLDLSLDSDATVSKEIMMSLIGTKIIGDKNQTDTTQTQKQQDWQHGSITFDDLVSNPKGTINLMTCDNTDDCQSISLQQQTYFGIEGYVNKMLFGTPNLTGDGNAATGVQTGSIVDLMSNGNSPSTPTSDLSAYGYTSSQISFLATVANTPVMNILRRSQHNSSLMAYAANAMVPVLVDDMAATYAQHTYNLARSVYQGSKNQPPDGYQDRMKEILNAATKYKKASQEQMKKISEIVEYLDKEVASDPQIKGWVNKLQSSKNKG